MSAIAGYKIISELYESAGSLVYRARREGDEKPVIIKALKAEYPAPEAIARYKLEYEITRNLNLSGTGRAYGLEKYKNSLVMVLEDFGGESLKIWMKSREFARL
jgi:serine/threonine protein kinase